MYLNTASFLNECNALGIIPDETALQRFEAYAHMLVQWNGKVNLTGITDPEGIAIKHFADSLTLLKYVDIPQNASIIDVGTGAGFPGIPLLIMRPDLKLTLLDSLQKRLNFLEAVLKETNLYAKLVHERAEDAGQNKLYREKYDFAVARAVANMSSLSEYCLPLVKTGGSYIAMKGAKAKEEMQGCGSAIEALGGEVVKQYDFTLGADNERCVINIKKISQTAAKYPRTAAKIAKKPL